MDFKTFNDSVSNKTPPSGLPPALEALWHDAKGDWHEAHATVQSESGKDSAWVHAYLHRKEGDQANASYWYSRAGKPVFKKSLEDEWQSMVQTLIKRI